MSMSILGAEALAEAELQALEVEAPVLAKTLRAQQSAILEMAGTVQKVAARHDAEVAREQDQMRGQILEAVDANPTLRAWRASPDQTLWQEATRLDKVLRGSPAYADVPFADRFAKVVELTQTALDVRNEHREEEAAERPSDTPAKRGKTLEEVSTAELGRQFIDLGDKDKIDAYLASLAR